MQLFFLAASFLVIVFLLRIRQPLYIAILGGLLVIILLFRISPKAWFGISSRVVMNWSSFSIIISLYLITFLQKMLESRQQIEKAEKDLDGIFHNRRINTTGAPLFIGLLPSAAAMVLCASIVKNSTEGYIKPKEQAFVASWFRHIPESTLPTYSGVLLMVTLSGVQLNQFMMAMIIPLIILTFLGYYPHLARLPKQPSTKPSGSRGRDIINLFKHLWSLILILALILVGKLQVVSAVLFVIALGAIVYRFKLRELIRLVPVSFETKLLGNTFLVLVFKEFIDYTGALVYLPKVLAVLPIPLFLIFSILFFVGGIISGTNGIIALGTPLAFAAIPDGGVALMVLLMGMAHAASQLSPTHICLLIAAEYFHVSLGDLIKKTLPVALLFCFLMILYYLVLRQFI